MNDKLAQLIAKTKEVDSGGSSDNKYALPYKRVFISPKLDKVIPDLHARLLLPDAAEGQIAVRYWTHWLGKEGGAVNCGWSIPGNAEPHCPVCDAIKDIKTATGVDHGKEHGAKGRSMVLAQYIQSSNYANLDKYPHPERGEVFIAQGPLGMYYEINDVIMKASAYPESLQQLILNNVGSIVSLSRTKENRASVTPIIGAQVQSAESDEAFANLLAGLPSAESLVYPGGQEQIEEEKLLLSNFANSLLKRSNSRMTPDQTPAHMGSQDVVMAGNTFNPVPTNTEPAPYTPPYNQGAPTPDQAYQASYAEVPQPTPYGQSPQGQPVLGTIEQAPENYSAPNAGVQPQAQTQYASPTQPTYASSEPSQATAQVPTQFGQSPDQALAGVSGNQSAPGASTAQPEGQQQFQAPQWKPGQ